MIFVNFKIYKETFSDGALKLAKVCRKVSEKTKVKIIPLVSALDLRQIKKEVGGQVWLQHVDLFAEGKHTGWVSPLAAAAAGADGILLNHSEHKIPPGKIRQLLKIIKSEKLPVMVAVKTKGQAEHWLKKLRPRPDYVAYEAPELIGGEVSVTEAKAETIKRIVSLLPENKIIVGAGIKSAADIKKSLKLGAEGVLVSSAVVRAKNPEKILTDLASAFSDGHKK